MASIRRTLSPVPRAGTLLNGEACAVASPLSKSSSCTQNFMQPSGGYLFSLFGSLDSHLAQRSYRPQERSKMKGQVWRRAICHFFICFVVGVFVGLTPVVSMMGLSMNMMPKHQAFSFEVITPAANFQLHDLISKNATPLVDSSGMKSNATILEPHVIKLEVKDENYYDPHVTEAPVDNSSIVYQKLLIIVTPTHARPFQAYYLSRLAHTLKLVPPPVLWIVVEMASESAETADMLMRTGVMHRHLVCKKNLTEIKDRRVHQRNVALSHIETHRLDGIVYFADDDNIYSVDLFEQMRQIRRFGTWMVAKQMESKTKTIVEGPVCNGTQVVGWHTNEMARRFRRFHAELSGFAFNSTILWDPKRWHLPTVEPIRQLDTVREGFQVTTFIERLVEDESQMEGLAGDCLRITVWNLQLESSYSFYPQEWFMKNDLDVIYTLS